MQDHLIKRKISIHIKIVFVLMSYGFTQLNDISAGKPVFFLLHFVCLFRVMDEIIIKHCLTQFLFYQKHL